MLRRRRTAYRWLARDRAAKVRRLTVGKAWRDVVALFNVAWPNRLGNRPVPVKKPILMD